MSVTVKIECGINFRLREMVATKPTPRMCFVEYNGLMKKEFLLEVQQLLEGFEHALIIYRK